MKSSRLAAAFIAGIATSGCLVFAYSILGIHSFPHYQFAALVFASALASRLKLKLPGVTGNMSVNLPFILIAAVQLGFFEALTVAAVSSAIQSLPRSGDKFSAIKALFNVNTMILASGACAMLWHSTRVSSAWSGSSVLIASCAAFFIANTVPVATIISLTEGAGVLRTWSSICELSLPYYLISTGILSIVMAAQRPNGWEVPVAVLPVMILTYRSFRIYFGRATDSATFKPIQNVMAKAAAAR